MDENKNIAIGKRIKNIRVSLGNNMEEFGKRLSPVATKGTVSKWENGKYIPSNDRLRQIAELGNVTMDFLLEGDKKIDGNNGIGNTSFSVKIHTRKNNVYDISGFYFIQREWMVLNGDFGLFLNFIFETDSHDFEDVLKGTAKEILNQIEYPKNENGKIAIFYVEQDEKTYRVKKMGFEV
ncbi:helix-turn-helix domain-containing protein [Lysinibacillus sp. NPDC096418]|uniref:helix-turn-helix domain-containing protein n=1 Tax=Lysinibacillus sp. NPDC096418 TaxID=3364138 RepID=UPI00381E85A9